VAGPHPTVILTTAALQTLDPDQLDAVLAHERAHLASHDHRLLAIAKIGRQVLPFLPLMRDADTQITRLVEMHADDAATADRDAGPLATALVVLAAAGPAPGLAAAATDAVQRIQRLLRPAEPLSRVRRQLPRAGSQAASGAADQRMRGAAPPAAAAGARARARAPSQPATRNQSAMTARPRPAPFNWQSPFSPRA